MLARGVILLVRGYQLLIAPHLPPTCRFFPSCSRYMVEAVRVHGAIRGVALGARRVLRCRPLGGSGFDFVPPKDPRRGDPAP